MKYVFQVFGTMLYGMVSSWLIWLLFYFVTPYIMGASWLFLFIYAAVAMGLVSTVFAFVSGILLLPMKYLVSGNMAAKVIYTIIVLFWAFSSAALPFHLNMEFGLLQWLLVLIYILTVLGTYAPLIAMAYEMGKD